MHNNHTGDTMQTGITAESNIVEGVDITTAEIESTTAEMLETGEIIELGKMPQAIYTRHEYSGADSLYILIPQHSTAIPLHGNNLQATIVQVLVDNKDLKSSQEVTDYPVVTHNHIELWYSDYTIVEHMTVVEIFKPRALLSGWELRRQTDRVNASRGHTKLLAKMKELQDDPFYAIMSEDQQREHRLKIGV